MFSRGSLLEPWAEFHLTSSYSLAVAAGRCDTAVADVVLANLVKSLPKAMKAVEE